VRTQELLKVEEGDLDVTRLEKIAKLFVHDEHTTIVRVLQAIFGDVLRDRLRDFTAGNQLPFRKGDESTELVADVLLTVEAVVLRTFRSLRSVRIVLLRLNLANNLRQGLNIGAESSEFSLDSFKRHLISLLIVSSLSLIFVTIVCWLLPDLKEPRGLFWNTPEY